MKYYRVLAACALLCAALLSACGGGGGGLGTALNSSTGKLIQHKISFLPAPEGQGLKQEVNYNYDFSAVPMVDGLAAVPMRSDTEPEINLASKCRISLSEDGQGGASATVHCEALDKPLIHFRYDPSHWQVQGVALSNPFAEATSFVPYVQLLQPGLIALSAVPAGDHANFTANGDFARIDLAPPGAPLRGSNATPPSGVADGWLIYYCHGTGTSFQIQSQGAYQYQLDGEYGNATSKDNDFDQSEFFWQWDNCCHDAKLTNFGQLTGWDPATQTVAKYPQVGQALSWTERLVGDYNNDGIVTSIDIVPIGELYQQPIDPNQQVISTFVDPPTRLAPGRVKDLNYATEDSLWRMMKYISGNPDVWLETPFHNIQLYYLFDWSNPPTGYDFTDTTSFGGTHGMAHVYAALDGFWDGYITCYPNYNPEDAPPYNRRDQYYTGFYNQTMYESPGDNVSIYRHLNERIDGYQVWTIASDQVADFNPTAPDLTTTANQVFEGDRGAVQDLIADYSDKPWSILPTTRECWRRADLAANLNFDSFKVSELDLPELPPPGYQGKFSIIMAPFAYIETWQTTARSFGPMTVLNDVLVINPAPGRGYGPQYHLTNMAEPTDNSTDNGIIAWDDGTDYRDSLQQTHLYFTYDNADNIDAWHHWKLEDPSNPLHYKLYVSTNQNTLFTSPLVTRTWSELDEEQPTEDENVRGMSFIFGPNEGRINWTIGGTQIWFGLRVVDATGNVIEYSNPANTFGANNTKVVYLVPTTPPPPPFGPQYRTTLNGLPYLEGLSPPRLQHTQRGIINASQSATTGLIRLDYYNADRVTADLNNAPIWDPDQAAARITYELFAYAAPASPPAAPPDASTVFAGMHKIAVWTESNDTASGGDTRYYSNALNTLLGGQNYYLGIRARNSGSTNNSSEYYVTNQAQNTTMCQLLVRRDFDNPYFIDPWRPYNRNSSMNDDSIINWYPYTNAILVRFRPAIDPPFTESDQNEPFEQITYHLYYSTVPFTAADTMLESVPTTINHMEKTFAYNAAIGPPWQGEWYEFLIENVTDPDVNYYVYVSAEDSQGNRSVNSKVHGASPERIHCARYQPLGWTIDSGGLGGPEAGDLVGELDDVYCTYTAFLASSPNEPLEARLSYDELLDGYWPNSSPPVGQYRHMSDVLANQYSSSVRMRAGIGQTKLDFRRDANGVITSTAGEQQTAISFAGFDSAIDEDIPGLQPLAGSVTYNTSYAWNNSYLQPKHDFSKFTRCDAITLFTAQMPDGLGSRITRYFNSWIDCAGSLHSIDEGNLLYNIASDPDVWPNTPARIDSQNEDYGSLSNCLWGAPDIEIAQTAVTPYSLLGLSMFQQEVPQIVSTMGLGYGLFVLANSSVGVGELNIADYTQYQKLRLFYTSDISSLSSWNWTIRDLISEVDLRKRLPGIDDAEAGRGPNALAVNRWLYSGTNAHVYVAYCDAPPGIYEPTDGKGLRVACAEWDGTTLGDWIGVGDNYLVDDVYRRHSSDMYDSPTNDQIDLAIRPECFRTDTQFNGLGIVYITEDKQVLLAETTGTGGLPVWRQASLTPIAEGQIYWVKLIYVPDATMGISQPYVLYGAATSKGCVSVRLWRPS